MDLTYSFLFPNQKERNLKFIYCLSCIVRYRHDIYLGGGIKVNALHDLFCIWLWSSEKFETKLEVRNRA